MDVEVVKSDLFEVAVEPRSKDGSSLLPKEENGVLHQNNGIDGPIRFGSHGVDEPKAKDGKNGPETNFPIDAVDEWPAPQQIHSFYFVKYRPYEDPELKAKMDKADANIQNKSQARSKIFEKIREKKSCRAELIAQLRPLREERRQMWTILGEKAKEIKPLNQALGQLRNTNGGPREKGVTIFSSELELNNHIKSLEYRIQHESISLPEEKQILREIKQLEGTRAKVSAKAAMRAKIEDSMGEKEAIQDQVNLMGVDFEGVKKDLAAIDAKIKPLDAKCEVLDDQIKSLDEELKAASDNQQDANKARNDLLKKRDEGNTSHYQNRAVLNKAKELAAKKDIEAVKELENSEVEKFMSLWNSSKAHRDDYEKRILSSLDFRQLSRDGRIRNPDEKPLVPVTPAFTAPVATSKTNVKQAKENHVSSSPQVVDKPQKEEKAVLTKENKKKETGSAVPVDLEEEKSSGSVDKLQKDSQPKQKEVDEAKSKEARREEELAKAKQALERKKKLAEKAAAKAAIKAQKEAEKKLKEREKKAKKKAAASGGLPETEERSADEEAEATEEPEKVVEEIKSTVPSKSKARKENTARPRTKPRGPEALPRAILKRKKSTNFWVWAVPAAAVAAGLAVLAVGYTYFI